MNEFMNEHQNNLAQSFQSAFGNEELLFQLVDLFPIPIEIFAPDGTSVFVNQACCEMWNVMGADQIVGNYNIIKDPVVNDQLGLRDFVRRVFDGETLSVSDIKVPLDDLSSRYEARDSSFDVFAIYNDITCFPILDNDKKIAYVVNIFVTKNLYQGRPDIAKAKEYMDLHWLDEFNLSKVAEAVNLSVYHFAHLFKKHTGETPYSYYKKIKVAKLKEMLRNRNLSISEVFTACGVDYNGTFARTFKENVGMSPSEYRESVIKR
jgi:AraC-like DNA-binding protein